MIVTVMKKDLATLLLEIALVRKTGKVLMTAHSVSFELMLHYKKFLFWLHTRMCFLTSKKI